MSTSYSARLKIATPATSDRNWDVPMDANLALLDALAPIGMLVVTTHEMPTSTSLLVDVAAGVYVDQSGTVSTYAGTTSFALTASNTNYLYLDLTASGALTKSTSGFPATAHVRLASAVATGSVISSITDARVVFMAIGPFAEGVNLSFGTTTGTKIGTSVSQKIGFWNVTPVVQPSGANQAAITDSSGGTASFTLAAVGATNTGDVSGTINDDIASLARAIAAIRTALVAAGIMKGSA